MIDIEAKVADSLRAEADQTITGQGLRNRAIARAATIRRRRRAIAVVAGVGLAAVLTAGVVAAPRLIPAGEGRNLDGVAEGRIPATPKTRGPASAPGPTTLPEITGVATAGEQPTIVGTEPGVLHFDVNVAALDARVAEVSEWVPGQGYESVAFTAGASSAPVADVFLSPSISRLNTVRTPPGDHGIGAEGTTIPLYDEGPEEPTTVHGRPGTVQKTTANGRSPLDVRPDLGLSGEWNFSKDLGPVSWVLRWQPVDGLHAVVQVRNGDRALAYAVADALRLDHAQRCVTPLRLTAVPAGATVKDCRTAVRRTPVAGRGVWVESTVTLEVPGTRPIVVSAEAKQGLHPHDAAQFKANRTVAGHPAQWRDDHPGSPDSEWWLWVPDFGTASMGIRGAAEADALLVAGGANVAADLAHPETWPHSPIG